MADEAILWDYEVLEMLCRVTGYKQDVLKHHIIKLAKKTGIKLPREKEGKITFS